jgi:hypothetical protein
MGENVLNYAGPTVATTSHGLPGGAVILDATDMQDGRRVRVTVPTPNVFEAFATARSAGLLAGAAWTEAERPPRDMPPAHRDLTLVPRLGARDAPPPGILCSAGVAGAIADQAPFCRALYSRRAAPWLVAYMVLTGVGVAVLQQAAGVALMVSGVVLAAFLHNPNGLRAVRVALFATGAMLALQATAVLVGLYHLTNQVFNRGTGGEVWWLPALVLGAIGGVAFADLWRASRPMVAPRVYE